jgi:hypothetical protein
MWESIDNFETYLNNNGLAPIIPSLFLAFWALYIVPRTFGNKNFYNSKFYRWIFPNFDSHELDIND